MNGWALAFSSQARKDVRNLVSAGLGSRLQALLAVLETDPWQPPFEKLRGELSGYYSRRINLQHRLVYEVFPDRRIVRVLRMWTHYGD